MKKEGYSRKSNYGQINYKFQNKYFATKLGFMYTQRLLLMKSFLFFVLIIVSESLYSLNLCESYEKVHYNKVLPRLKSAIPFNLKLVVKNKDDILNVETIKLVYDLWDEEVELEFEDRPVEKNNFDRFKGYSL